MQMTIKDIAASLGCSDRNLYIYLNNWRFCKYKLPITPITFEVNEFFVKDFNSFLQCQRQYTTRKLAKKLDKLYEKV